MRTAGKVALGCLLTPVAFGLLMAVIVMGARLQGVPEPELAQVTLGKEVEGPAGTDLTRREPRQRDEPAQDAPMLSDVHVILDLEEAEFEIYPGDPEDGIKVQADYDRANYDLVEEYDLDGRKPVYRLSLKPKVSFLTRLLNKGQWTDEDMVNFVRIQLPRETPMDLDMKIAKSETVIDLTGLALTGLRSRLSMGEYRMEVMDPNPRTMEAVTLDCKMGEFHVDGLARLRPAKIIAKGMMGEMDLDLGGPLHADTEIDANMKMGEMSLRLPDNAVWDNRGLKKTLGEVSGIRENPGDPSVNAPVLQFAASVLMGELRMGSYHADPAREPLPDQPRLRQPREVE